MLNVIRTSPSRVNYCGRTVDNLIASNKGEDHRAVIVASSKSANENGLAALRTGIELSHGEPFVFLEDDLAFIRGFNQAAADFVRDCEGVRSPIFPLCAAHKELAACRGIAWRYPIPAFFGTQAFVIRPEEARSFLDWTVTLGKLPRAGFDLLIKKWALASGASDFYTPYRSFIQHCGVESSLHNGRFHHYPSWPGADWRYHSSAFSLKEQKGRPCDQALASAIAECFGTDLPAYDLGSSTGNYVKALRSQRIHATGFDATPGIASDLVEELDLSRPQEFPEPKGNILCLEVGEHIQPVNEPHLIANIAKLCAGKLVLSWASPGQGGRRHVNEKAASAVVSLMQSAGFRHDDAKARELRDVATLSWFKQSLYVFEIPPE